MSLLTKLYIPQHKKHDRLCNDGIARTAIRTGDIRRYIYTHGSVLCVLMCVSVCTRVCVLQQYKFNLVWP